MDADRIDHVTEWDETSYSDGYAGLRRLADREFSGAVTDGAAWLFMLNGRVVGVVDGDLEGFADASGTAYEAPHDALPLLYVMQELGGETRAQYYTNDTPLSEADRTLSAGNFTGYIELSENVLSGDYYVAYYGGESLSCAFVGNSRTLKTGEEAFGLADDEVGIYRVVDVELDVREVPESEPAATDASAEDGSTAGGSSGGTSAAGTTGNVAIDGATTKSDASPETGSSGAAERTEQEEPSNEDRSIDPIDEIDPVNATADATGSDPADRSPSRSTDGDSASVDAEAEPSVDDADADDNSGSAGGSGERTASESASNVDTDDGTDVGTAAGTDGAPTAAPTNRQSEGSGSPSDRTTAQESEPAGESAAADPDEDVFSEEEEWREARSIPALDPKKAGTDGRPARKRSSGRSSGRAERDGQSARTEDRGTSETTASDRSGGSDQRSGGQPSGDGTQPRSTTTEPSKGADGNAADRKQAVSERPSVQRSQLQRQVNRLEEELNRAETEREKAIEEHDAVAAERDEYRQEAERLESRVTELESELESVRGELREARAQLPDGERSMSPADALAGTNLFIRYDSQGGATLEKAHDGEVDREQLAENLKLEYHTSFEEEDVVVDGKPYEEFLRGTMEYGFTRWVAEELPFEVRETGNVGTLADLYDAIPEIDRAEIGGSVSIRRTENGEETREQRTFDLVLRNRMGTPLFVADLNDSREPTPELTLEDLVEHGSHLAESDDAFAAGFAVTSSFFEPGALETADDATGGGILGRSKRKSYVKISRKRGYHLCLAESRDGGFHLTVPEL